MDSGCVILDHDNDTPATSRVFAPPSMALTPFYDEESEADCLDPVRPEASSGVYFGSPATGAVVRYWSLLQPTPASKIKVVSEEQLFSAVERAFGDFPAVYAEVEQGALHVFVVVEERSDEVVNAVYDSEDILFQSFPELSLESHVWTSNGRDPDTIRPLGCSNRVV